MSTLVIAEHDNSNLKPSTLNTLAAANAIGGSVHLLVAGSSCQAVADACAAVDGVEKVLLADDAAYANQLAESTANLIKSVATNYSHILAPATTFGKNVLPRLSALLDVQQISEITEVISEDTFIRPIYAGNAFATVKSNDKIKCVTIRPTSFDPAPSSGGSAEIQKVFKVSNAGKIAGSKVMNGEIKSKSKARIIRDGVVVYSGEIQTIYREKNQVKEVGTGLECGISLNDFIAVSYTHLTLPTNREV